MIGMTCDRRLLMDSLHVAAAGSSVVQLEDVKKNLSGGLSSVDTAHTDNVHSGYKLYKRRFVGLFGLESCNRVQP